MTTIIIGAGAGGLACAIRLKQNMPSCEVIVLERLNQPGKKILATGNGRCNLSNTNAFGYNDVISFFNDMGLMTKADDEGRVYPYSNQASTVVDMLIKKCAELDIDIITDCKAESISSDLCIHTDKGIFMADYAVIAAGGMAQKNLGSDGSGYALLKALGHSITPLSPALVMLTSSSKYPRILKGCKAKCSISILLDNETVEEQFGEVLFTDYGLSGIVVMNLSHIVSRNFSSDNPKKCHAVLDLIPDMTEKQIIDYLNKFKTLDGILGTKLSDIICKQAENDIYKMAKYVKMWKLIITGTKGYDFAQITNGGADSSEFIGCKSKLVDHLYICGEIMDKQFACGGFNLNHAWYSGIRVADEIACSQS
ncbi:MAG: aminoacetone oxidase family FAD-binding enzyme [Clostridium sp.]|nr:aminoacetone oxidase family FAD-binding enzyme [Clostridium sp.]